jgi:hypothetical protein
MPSATRRHASSATAPGEIGTSLPDGPHGFAVEAEFRGSGGPMPKSDELSLPSVQPPSARNNAVVDDTAGAADVPSKKLALP